MSATLIFVNQANEKLHTLARVPDPDIDRLIAEWPQANGLIVVERKPLDEKRCVTVVVAPG